MMLRFSFPCQLSKKLNTLWKREDFGYNTEHGDPEHPVRYNTY